MISVKRWAWQSPPGWPEPPPGWSPPPGWRPDPSWPQPPEGWQWWRQTPRSRPQRWGLGLLVGVSGLMVMVCCGLPAIVEEMGQLAGCGSIDLTDPRNYSEITIVNDTPGSVVVDDCSGGECHPDQLPASLGPGQRYGDHAACGVSGADMTSWRVRSSDGSVLGYIAVDTPRKHDGLVFRVSRASHDRRTPTPPG